MPVPDEILSVAVFEPEPGCEAECLATVRRLVGVLSAKNYSRDHLYPDPSEPNRHILVRYWASESARREAQEDPEAQRCWAQLAHLTRVVKMYESLEELPL
jgi:quinol monooxygenase YgiN